MEVGRWRLMSREEYMNVSIPLTCDFVIIGGSNK